MPAVVMLLCVDARMDGVSVCSTIAVAEAVAIAEVVAVAVAEAEAVVVDSCGAVITAMIMMMSTMTVPLLDAL